MQLKEKFIKSLEINPITDSKMPNQLTIFTKLPKPLNISTQKK